MHYALGIMFSNSKIYICTSPVLKLTEILLSFFCYGMITNDFKFYIYTFR